MRMPVLAFGEPVCKLVQGFVCGILCGRIMDGGCCSNICVVHTVVRGHAFISTDWGSFAFEKQGRFGARKRRGRRVRFRK